MNKLIISLSILLLLKQNAFAIEDFINQAKYSSPVCSMMVQDVARRDQDAINFCNTLVKRLQSHDQPYQQNVESTLLNLAELENQ